MDAFAASMSPGYRLLFDPRTVRAHASVAWKRRGRPAYAELWKDLGDGTAALCVVADDRPGLLSLIALALAACGLDVSMALIFSRTVADGSGEAVDLFWVRRVPSASSGAVGAVSAVSAEDVAATTSRLVRLLRGEVAVADVLAGAPQAHGPPASCVDVTLTAEDQGRSVLTVEAPDAPYTLFLIARTLYEHGAQITRCLVRTAGGRTHNRFEIEDAPDAGFELRRPTMVAAVARALEAGPRGAMRP